MLKAAREMTAKWVRSRSLWIVFAVLWSAYDLARHEQMTVLYLGAVFLAGTLWFGGKAWASLIDKLPEMIAAWRGSQ